MNPIREAIEIAQIMAATRTTTGVGRLLRLLETAQAQFFTDAEDVAQIAEDDSPFGAWFEDEPPFPAA
jgi:hypothetical protein